MFTQATLVLAALDLTSIVWWLLVGLIAGFLASVVMRGGGYGIVGDIVVGLIGAFIGGFLASLVGLGSSGLIGTIIIAFIGACVLIALLRLVSRGTARRY
ncbi:GlsB/YeaQ/YmgE family stress response membrane protein [Ktedonobacter racemifer]|uniref:Transglycosylase-associated protein n=1 Tax=Ktedonobacter racemifer DSM 44963 TaxID=485913 RepID=D6U5C3_KTERA|nr:GlsB/YeaQ/YmgE family stress response membrane protein [Ktedonobacter racemifer]EFH81703.1 Transglycosylase-associated protein [Ktedonobacter racemifer DSM 44963]